MKWFEKILKEQSDMENISIYYASLKWTEDISHSRSYNLHSYNKIIGSLKWENKKGSFAFGEVCGVKYYISKKGILKPRLIIRDIYKTELNSELPYRKKTSSGELILSNGQIFNWKRNASWKNEWKFYRTEYYEAGNYEKAFKILITFTSITSSGKSGCFVKVHDINLGNNILSMMLLLGMYYIATSVDDNLISISLD